MKNQDYNVFTKAEFYLAELPHWLPTVGTTGPQKVVFVFDRLNWPIHSYSKQIKPKLIENPNKAVSTASENYEHNEHN